MTPEPNHIDSERASARSLEPSAVLREIVDSWQLPDGNDSPAEEPCPDYADGPRFSLAELIDQQAMGYKAWGTGVGDFLARHMEELASMVRWTKAATPEEHEARIEVYDEELRQRWEAVGFEKGRRSCLCSQSQFD